MADYSIEASSAAAAATLTLFRSRLTPTYRAMARYKLGLYHLTKSSVEHIKQNAPVCRTKALCGRAVYVDLESYFASVTLQQILETVTQLEEQRAGAGRRRLEIAKENPGMVLCARCLYSIAHLLKKETVVLQ